MSGTLLATKHSKGVGATQHMALYCFDVLSSKLNNHPITVDHKVHQDHKSPLFVTWEKQAKSYGGESWNLRGCIGNFSQDLHLASALKDYALISALEDTRFPPIKAHELPTLRCAVSVLHSFEDAEPFDWEVGTHGILIVFPISSGKGRATFLPEVCSENDWDQMTCFQHLLRKGGYRGPFASETWISSNVTLTRYQSSKLKIPFQSYLKHTAVSTEDTEDEPTSSIKS